MRQGVTRDIVFYGDYMAVMPNDSVTEALKGVPFERERVAAVLNRPELGKLFGGIGEKDILDTLFGE